MAISVELFNLSVGNTQIGFAPGDVQFGDAENLTPAKNLVTAIITIPLRRRRLTLNARGVSESVLSTIQSAREASINRLVTATSYSGIGGQNLNVGGIAVTNAHLLDFQPGAPIYVEGTGLLEQVSLVYDSLTWE